MNKLLLLTLTIVAVQAQFVLDPYRFATAVCSQYTTANVAAWTGTQFPSRNSAITGLADSKIFTVSFWLQEPAVVAGEVFLDFTNNSSTHRFRIQVAASGQVQLDGYNSSAVNIFQVNTSASISDTNWHHYFIAADLNDSANRVFYVDGTPVTVTWGLYDNDTIDFSPTTPRMWWGQNIPTGTLSFSGALAEFWLDDTYTTNVSKFYCGGRPADLGADGSLPTGSSPALYLSRNGSGNSWLIDSSGNGNDFTASGTLNGGTSP